MANLDQIVNYIADSLSEDIIHDYKSASKTSGTSSVDIFTLATLPKGVWVISLYASFSQNSTGVRSAYIAQDDVSTGASMRVPACSNSTTVLPLTTVVKSSGASVLKLGGFQNSGSTLTVTVSYSCIRVA